MLQFIPRLVSADINENLGAKVFEEEVRRAVFSLGASKAPGPYGFNGIFFQKNWENIKEEVYVAVKEFFNEGILPRSVNETLVTLVPKTQLSESINQLLP